MCWFSSCLQVEENKDDMYELDKINEQLQIIKENTNRKYEELAKKHKKKNKFKLFGTFF